MRKQLTVLAMAVLATSATAWAGQPSDADDGERRLHRGGDRHLFGDPARALEHMSRALDLEDTQRQSIENITSATKPELDALRERAVANRQAFRELDAGDPDHDVKLANLAREKGDIAAEMALLHGRMKADVHAVLTPEQRQQLADRVVRMKRHHGGKHHRQGRDR